MSFCEKKSRSGLSLIWGLISTTLLLGCALSPIALWVLGFNPMISVLVALFFWPALAQIIYEMIKHRRFELPRIAGGPTFNWAGKSYGLRGRR